MSTSWQAPPPMYCGGAGTTLVLRHGATLTWRAWIPVLAALEAEHDVLALTLPGPCGARSLPSGVAPSSAALADAVELRPPGADETGPGARTFRSASDEAKGKSDAHSHP